MNLKYSRRHCICTLNGKKPFTDDRPAWRAAIEQLLSDDAYLREQELRVKSDYRLITWRDSAHDVLAAIATRLPGVAAEARDPDRRTLTEVIA